MSREEDDQREEAGLEDGRLEDGARGFTATIALSALSGFEHSEAKKTGK